MCIRTDDLLRRRLLALLLSHLRATSACLGSTAVEAESSSVGFQPHLLLFFLQDALYFCALRRPDALRTSALATKHICFSIDTTLVRPAFPTPCHAALFGLAVN